MKVYRTRQLPDPNATAKVLVELLDRLGYEVEVTENDRGTFYALVPARNPND